MRFLAYEFLTGRFTDEIPFDGFRFSATRSRRGGWSASLPSGKKQAARTVLDRAKTLVYVEDSGDLLFGGILWNRSWSPGTLKVGGTDLFGYFHRRKIRDLLGFGTGWGLNAEQFDIVEYLVGYAQSFTRGNLRVQVRRHPQNSGVLRTKVFLPDANTTIGEAIEGLADLANGFEFTTTVEWSTTSPRVPVHYLDLWYPGAGRSTGWVWQHGRDVNLKTHDDDGDQLADLVDAIGGTGGVTPGVKDIETVGPFDNGYPLLEGEISLPDVTDHPILAAAAAAELAAVQDPAETATATIRRLDKYPLSAWNLGDAVTLLGSDGPGLSVNDLYRIQGYEATVNGERVLGIDVDLSEGARYGRPILSSKRRLSTLSTATATAVRGLEHL